MTFREKLEKIGKPDTDSDVKTEVTILRPLVVSIGQEVEAERNPFADPAVRKDFGDEYERICNLMRG